MPRKKLTLFVFASLALVLAACTTPTAPTVEAVAITPAGPFALEPGETQQLTAAVTTTGAADETVTWSSSDESVATVDADGLVTGLALGSATITVTSDFDETVQDSVELDVLVRAFAHCPAATSHYVSSSAGAAGATGTSPLTPLNTVQAAIDAAAADATVCVAAGTYAIDNSGEGSGGATINLVTIDKAITLVGPNTGVAAEVEREAEAVLVVSSEEADTMRAIAITSGDVVVDGFTITTETPKEDPFPDGIYGVWVSPLATDGVIINNNRIVDANHPIMVNRGRDAGTATGYEIANNVIEGPNAESDQAIYVQGAFGSVIDNVIRDARVGIQVQPYQHAGTGSVTGNDIEAFQVGLWFNYQEVEGSNWTFSDNVVTGIASPWGWPLYTTDTIVWSGIRVETFHEGTVTFSDNTVAVGTADPSGDAYLLRQRGGSNGTINGIGTVTELGAFFTDNSFPDFGAGGVTIDDLTEEGGHIQLLAPTL